MEQSQQGKQQLKTRIQKGGKLRVCLDPRDLNRAIKRDYHPLPTLEDITAKLSKAKFFTKLDARSGYWQVKLDQDSSMLTTFNTPFGRYRFLRMPFGVHSAQDVFERLIDKTFGDLPGVAAIIDDILVYGETKQEHEKLTSNSSARQRTGIYFQL